ncbi:MAG: hypothetical protein EB121_09380, partial [Alphaproteobacteria bacterium]|nr:hypothetical protein [Alphaproteobacteria bacterium]
PAMWFATFLLLAGLFRTTAQERLANRLRRMTLVITDLFGVENPLRRKLRPSLAFGPLKALMQAVAAAVVNALGIAFGFGIPMAFAALTNSLPLVCWVLLIANIFWAIAYDTEYAMVDRDDDIHLGIKTSAITFGRLDVMMVMLAYGVTLGLLLLAGRLAALGLGWWLGLTAAALIAVYHYHLIKDRSRDGCFKAFNHNNWFGAAVFCGLPLDSYLSQWGI